MKAAGKWIIRRLGVALLVFGTAASLILGYVGFSQLPMVGGGTPTIWDRIYLTLQLFIAESGYVAMPAPWQLEVARLLAPLVAAYAAVGAIFLVFYERILILWARLTYRNHVVVCGLGDIGTILVHQLIESGKRVIVIEPDGENKNIRQVKDLGAVVISGDPGVPSILKRARVGMAESVIAVCETDGMNTDIAHEVGRLARRGRVLKCYAHVINRYLCHFLMGQAITTQTDDHFQLEFFNIADSGARLLTSQEADRLETQKEKIPHMVIIGTGSLAESLIVGLERIWRRQVEQTQTKLRISLFDQEATMKSTLLALEYPLLTQTCAIAAYDLDVHTPGFLAQWPEFQRSNFIDIDKIFICLENDNTALEIAFLLQQRARRTGAPVVVVLRHYDGLAKAIEWRREGGDKRLESDPLNLSIFRYYDLTCRLGSIREGIYEDLAIAIHRGFCASELARGRSPQDPGLASWYPKMDRPGLSEVYKEDNRRQARAIGRLLWNQGYAIEPLNCVNPTCFEFESVRNTLEEGASREESELEGLARMEHARWMKEKKKQGWKAGPHVDSQQKIHTLLYDWDDPRLDETAREKTRQMIRGWPNLLAQVDLQIVRRSIRSDPSSKNFVLENT